jgi:hypothetical protein
LAFRIVLTTPVRAGTMPAFLGDMRIREIVFQGHAAFEVVERGVRMVVVHDVGPRIAWFGHATNLLFWDDDEKHRRGEWKLYGGHRLWLTRPGADESEETYVPDNGACLVRKTPHSIQVTTPLGVSMIERSLKVDLIDGAFRITHRIRNRGDMLWSGGAWALTCTQPVRRTRYRIPLGDSTAAWEATTLVIPTRWGGSHTSRLADPQFAFARDALVVRPSGIEGKRMLGAPAGVLEMTDHRGMFRKHAPYVPHARYPLATNVALYIGPNNFMVELETMGPLRTLAPGESLFHVETWTLA